MTQARIRAAFETVLNTWAGAQSPAIPVAWQNITFTPPAGRHVRAYLLPANTVSLDLLRVTRTYKGIFQISLYVPSDNTGMGAAEALIASLDTAFSPSAPLSSGGLSVWIEEPISVGPAMTEDDQVHIPLSLIYQAHST